MRVIEDFGELSGLMNWIRETPSIQFISPEYSGDRTMISEAGLSYSLIHPKPTNLKKLKEASVDEAGQPRRAPCPFDPEAGHLQFHDEVLRAGLERVSDTLYFKQWQQDARFGRGKAVHDHASYRLALFERT